MGTEFIDAKAAEILALPRKTLIEDLIKVLDDSCARFNYFTAIGNYDEKTNSFPIHALWLLSELKAYEALPTALHLIRQPEYWMHYWFGDLLTEGLSDVFYRLGDNNLELLKDYAKEPDNYAFARAIAPNVVSMVAFYQPERRQEALAWLSDVCQYMIDNHELEGVSDYTFNSMLVHDVMDCKGEEFFNLLEEMYDMGIVDMSFNGDWEDTLSEYREYTQNRDTPSNPYRTMQEMYDWMKEMNSPV